MCTPIIILLIHLFLLFLLPNFTQTTITLITFLSSMDSTSEPNGDDRSSSRAQNDRQTHRISSSSVGSTNFIGKHRLAAIIAQQNLQIQIIQEELDELETLGESSLVCEQLISSVESSTDALLPVTRGPADGGWDRWFQRATQSSSRNRKRWI